MLRRRASRGTGTRVRFAMDGSRRVVTVEGPGLPEIERRRLRRLLKPLPIRSGSFVVRSDWAGRRRVSFSKEIPEPVQQTIRNIVGNLSRLRAP